MMKQNDNLTSNVNKLIEYISVFKKVSIEMKYPISSYQNWGFFNLDNPLSVCKSDIDILRKSLMTVMQKLMFQKFLVNIKKEYLVDVKNYSKRSQMF